MGRMAESSTGARRFGAARVLKVAVLTAILAMLVAVPVALAMATEPISSTNYDFADTGASGAAGEWKRIDQTVPIMATPSMDSTVTAYFRVDNGVPWVASTAKHTQTETFHFTVTAEGSNQISYYAGDSSPASDEEEQGPFLVNIDKTAPLTTPTGLDEASTQSAAAHWSSETTRTITLVASDAGPRLGMATSGVQAMGWDVGGVSVVITKTAPVSFTVAKGVDGVLEGSNAVTYFARDWAGNIEATRTGYVNIDTVEPTTTASPALALDSTTGWFNEAVRVSLDWTDVSSGVPGGGTTYELDDGNLSIYSVPFLVSKEGSTKLTYRSVDRAGNVEAMQTSYLNIDTVAPKVTRKTVPSHRSGWYRRDVVVTLTGSDAVSGVAETQYRVVESVVQPWATAAGNHFTVLASDNAIETFQYRTLDNAGNASAVGSLKLRMDSIKPRTYGKGASGRRGRSISLKYRITDNLSPKAKSIWYKIKNSRGKTIRTRGISGTKTINKRYSFSWRPKARGTYRYYMYAKDLAGNSQRVRGAAKITVR